MARESDADRLQRHDREWRELALESLDELREKVHAHDLELAVVKAKMSMVAFLTGLVTSSVVTVVLKWIMK